MPSEFWELVQQFGLPITMLLVFIWTIYRKIFTPGWYAAFLEDQLKTEKAKNDELIRKNFELASLARTAIKVGEAIVNKESG